MNPIYERDGIVFPVPVLDADEARHYRVAAEALLARDPNGSQRPHLWHEWALELSTHPSVVQAVEAVFGEALIWGSLILRKPPHSRAFVSWHQDGAYRHFAPGETITAWIALADSTRANGCMQVVRGSHRTRLPHRDQPDADNMITLGKEVEVDVTADQITNVELRAGEMSLHHNDLIHGSGPNDSDAARVGFIVRYMKPWCVWDVTPVVPARSAVAR